MKICYLCDTVSAKKLDSFLKKYNNKVQQQAQKYNRLLMEGLQKNGASVTCVSSQPINRAFDKKIFFKKEKETEKEIEYIYLPFINFGLFRKASIFFGTFFTILKQKKDTVFVCDAMNISMSLACVIACKLLKRKNIAVITDVPCYRPDSPTPTKAEKLNLKIMQKFDSYLLLTEAMNDVVNPKRRPYVVLEGHGDEEMKNMPNELSEKAFPRVCLYAGTLRSVYGIESLVNGFLAADLKDAELHIYGQGDFESKLREICKTTKNVKYYGLAPNEEIVKAETKATLLVNPRPTDKEYTKFSFPSKNMEYMASGTPILTTRLPGMPKEYYDYIYTIDKETPEGIKEKLQEIFSSDPETVHKFGLKAKEFIINEKSNVVQAKKMMRVLIEDELL